MRDLYDRIEVHAKETAELNKLGVIDVCPSHVHLTKELFKKLSKGERCFIKPRQCDTYPYEEHFIHGGIYYLRLIE